MLHISTRLFELFEPAADRRVVDPQMRRDLTQPIPLLVRLGDPFFSSSGKNLFQGWLGGSELRSRNLFQVRFSGSVLLEKRLAAQIDLSLEIVPRPARHSVADKFPIVLLRAGPALAKLL